MSSVVHSPQAHTTRQGTTYGSDSVGSHHDTVINTRVPVAIGSGSVGSHDDTVIDTRIPVSSGSGTTIGDEVGLKLVEVLKQLASTKRTGDGDSGMGIARITKTGVKPTSFTGSANENVILFLEEYNLIATAERWSSSLKCRQLPIYLKEAARNWYLGLDGFDGKVDKDDWHSISKALVEAFKAPNHERVIKRKLLARRQLPNEDVQTFATELVNLSKQLEDHNLDHLTDIFIQGLKPQIQIKLIESNGDDVDLSFLEVVKQAKRFESAYVMAYELSTSRNRDVLNKPKVNNVFESTDGEQTHDEIASSIAPVQVNNTRQEDGQKETLTSLIKELLQELRKKKGVSCWTCQGPHLAKYCPSKSKGEHKNGQTVDQQPRQG